MVTFSGTTAARRCAEARGELRREKLRVDVYPEGEQEAREAAQVRVGRHVPVLAILGEDEQARGEVACATCRRGSRRASPRQSAARVRSRRRRRGPAEPQTSNRASDVDMS